jgi:hypothetical protein
MANELFPLLKFPFLSSINLQPCHNDSALEEFTKGPGTEHVWGSERGKVRIKCELVDLFNQLVETELHGGGFQWSGKTGIPLFGCKQQKPNAD